MYSNPQNTFYVQNFIHFLYELELVTIITHKIAKCIQTTFIKNLMFMRTNISNSNLLPILSNQCDSIKRKNKGMFIYNFSK